ncbi:MAG: PspA/IM30 family protein, partial [Inquilinus limosus]|nr:PspA/IM30 family protein [Inquilinus limosus]
QLEAAQAEWQRKAELAVEKGREDLAKGALVAKAQAATAAELLRRELETIESALAKTNEDLGRLEAKLTEAKNKQKSFTIRHDAARDQIRIRTQLHDGRIDEALSRYEHIERKIDTLEGQVESFDLGRRKTLQDEFADLEAESGVEKELQAIKDRLGRTGG